MNINLEAIFLAVISAICGALLAIFLEIPGTPGTLFYSSFEADTGIHPEAFLKARTVCEAHYREPCRLYGGWAPQSAFEDNAK